jgi:hypothetical protein
MIYVSHKKLGSHITHNQFASANATIPDHMETRMNPSQAMSRDTTAQRRPLSPLGAAACCTAVLLLQASSAIAFSPTWTLSRTGHLAVATVGTTEPLHFRFNDDDDNQDESRPWWKSITSSDVLLKRKSDPAAEQQAKVDDYLRFLDKRYHRLHDDDEEKPSNQHSGPQFASTWKWLMQQQQQQSDSTSPTAMRTPEEQEHDALYVLGVAGLASQALLKHYKQPQPVREMKLTPNVSPSSWRATVVDAQVTPVSQVLQSVAYRRARLVRQVERQTRALLLAVGKVLVTGPIRLAQALVRYSGGVRNLLALGTVAVAALVLLTRPLMQAILVRGPYETASSAAAAAASSIPGI